MDFNDAKKKQTKKTSDNEKEETFEVKICKENTWNTKPVPQSKLKAQCMEEKAAKDARRKATRDKWDEETAPIKQVLWAEAKPFLTENQKPTLNHVKTYLLENGRGFLVPVVKRIPLFRSGTARSQTRLRRLVFSVPLSSLQSFPAIFTSYHFFPQVKFLFFCSNLFG